MDNTKVFSSFIWRFMERCGAQGITLIVSIVLARVLAPEDFGIVALIMVFISILQVLVDSGLGAALIQKKDADELDFSSVFIFNLCMCTFMYIGMFLIAPLIATFYQMQELTDVIRVASLVIIVYGIKNIQQAYVSRNLLFKKFFYSTLSGSILAAFIGIYMAVNGFGVWALVAQLLVNAVSDTCVLWITVKWRPRLKFSVKRLKVLINFGWKLMATLLIDTIYRNIRQLLIGRIYSAEQLAFFNRGEMFPILIVTNINTSIDSVLLPTMSAEQENRMRVRDMTRRAIKTSTYIIMPIMMGLAVCAESIVAIILTEKWLPCVPFLRIFCIAYAFETIQTANLNAVNALGRSDIYLKLEIIKKAIGFIIVLVTIKISVLVMAYSVVGISFLWQVINAYPNRKLLGYKYEEQIVDVLPHIGLSTLMGAIVFCLKYIDLSPILTLLLQMFTGISIYVLGSIVFKLESFIYLKEILAKLFKRKI